MKAVFCVPSLTGPTKPFVDAMANSIGPVIASEGKTGGQLNSAVESWIETEMRVIDPTAYQ